MSISNVLLTTLNFATLPSYPWTLQCMQTLNTLPDTTPAYFVIFDSKTPGLGCRMKTCSLFICVNFCCIYRYTSIKIKPELKKKILKFGYGIIYKYEGILTNSFNTFYVVTKFIFPTASDISFSKFNFKDNSEKLTRFMGTAGVR